MELNSILGAPPPPQNPFRGHENDDVNVLILTVFDYITYIVACLTLNGGLGIHPLVALVTR